MAGDVNMFFHDFDDEGVAEINTMIADPSSRRKGLAKEALCLMMKYVMENLKATKFVAKISDSNEASLNLFRSFFKFDQTGHSDAFEETTLEAVVSNQFKLFIEEHTKGAITDAQGYDKS
jgi:RimJ/RimL family protein N-acetyltransferase